MFRFSLFKDKSKSLKKIKWILGNSNTRSKNKKNRLRFQKKKKRTKKKTSKNKENKLWENLPLLRLRSLHNRESLKNQKTSIVQAYQIQNNFLEPFKKKKQKKKRLFKGSKIQKDKWISLISNKAPLSDKKKKWKKKKKPYLFR